MQEKEDQKKSQLNPSLKRRENKNLQALISELHNDETTEEYDPYKTPPSLELSKLHYKCSGIGEPILDAKYCPCCLQPQKKPFSFNKYSHNVFEFGSTISLYFQFSKHVLILMTLYLLGNIYPLIKQAEYYCSLETDQGRICNILNFKMFYDYTDFYFNKENGEKIRNIYTENYWVSYGVNLVMIYYVLFFQIGQECLITRLEFNKKLSPSDFSIMVGNVDETQGEKGVRDFIEDECQTHSFGDLGVVKVNLGTMKGNSATCEKKIFETKKKIENLEEYAGSLLHLTKKDAKLIESQKKKLEKEMKKTEKSLKKFKDCENKCQKEYIEKSSKNAIAFVTFKNPSSVKKMLQIREKKQNIFKRVCPCYKKKMQIMEAPEPDDINWRYIGYTTVRRCYSNFIITIIAMILLTLLSGGLFLLQILKSFLGYGKNDLSVMTRMFLNIIPNIMILAYSAIFRKLLIKFGNFLKQLVKNKYYVFITEKLARAASISFIVTMVVLIGTNKAAFFKVEDKHDLTQIFCKTVVFYFAFKSILDPVMTLFPLKFLIDLWKNRNIGELQYDNIYPKTKFHYMSQKEFNKTQEREDCKIDMKYAKLISLMFNVVVTSFFRIPIIPILGVIYILNIALVDKILFYYRYKKPSESTVLLARKMRKTMRIIPLCYFLMRIVFILSDKVTITGIEGVVKISAEIFIVGSMLYPWKYKLNEKIEKEKKTMIRAYERSEEFRRESTKTIDFDSFNYSSDLKEIIEKELMSDCKLQNKLKIKKVENVLNNIRNQFFEKKMKRFWNLKNKFEADYNEAELDFDVDYDRLNPATANVSSRLWKKRRLEKLKEAKIESVTVNSVWNEGSEEWNKIDVREKDQKLNEEENINLKKKKREM